MEEENEALVKIINKVLERTNCTKLKFMNELFLEIAKEASDEGFLAGHEVGYYEGYSIGFCEGAGTDE